MLDAWIGGKGADYNDFVWRAVLDTRTFDRFRRDKVYCRILEHVNQEQGSAYLALIADPVIRGICFDSEYADAIGKPQVAVYEGHKISPTTLRYAKVVSDLTQYFPDFAACRSIVEIGIGYGGQARLVSEYAKRVGAQLTTYTLIDLPPVLSLAQRYLDHFALQPRCRFETKSMLARDESWDLVISNYAFSEFNRELQEEYLTLILKKARSGYLTMNTGLPSDPPAPFPRLTVREVMSALPNPVIRREEPLTAPRNYIIAFGEHRMASNFELG